MADWQRLFVALVPPAYAVADLLAQVAAARAAAPDDPAIRWARAEQLHVTLSFLGDVRSGLVAELGTRLERAARRHAAMDLRFAGAGRFGQRVLWAGVGGPADRLRALAASVSGAARRTGIPQEERRFRAHVTLARGRDGAELRPAVAALAAYEGPLWRAERVTLVRSELGRGPGGTAAYTEVGGWPLAAGA